MAKLPTALDLSGPEFKGGFRSGRQYASADTTAIGRGMASMGGDIQALGGELKRQADEEKAKQNAVDIARAEAFKTEGFINTQNEFDNDPDYSTYQKRVPAKTGEIVKNAANVIRDPEMRERWQIGAQTDSLRVNDSIFDRGTTLRRQTEVVAFDDALETNRRIYVDPNTSEEAKAKAKADIDGAIKTGLATGLLTPEAADSRRKTFIEDAEFSRGKLEVERDPSVLSRVDNTPIIDAMIGVESGGSADAVSPKGALGLMQVMPGTAAEIARELGDEAFPRTPEAQAEYLKDPAVSRAYGTHYFEKMLKRYDGDVDAALIAYNGGADRADKWLASGRDDNVIPQESANYYKKVRAKADGVTVALPRFPDANRFLKTRLASQHGHEHIDGMVPQFQARLAGLINAAPPEIRDGLGIFSGRRTTARQRELWLASDRTGRNVARPGHSRHEHGDAADLSYNGKSLKDAPPNVVKWVHANAAAFGLKFPLGHEPWHVEMQETRGGKPPAWFNNLSPEQRQVVLNQAETRQNQINVETRAALDVATTNAPAAILNTGSYDGALPTADQFMSAYGPQEGAERFNSFLASVETSEQAYDMRTMSTEQISEMVNAARPVSSGDDAALETKRYNTLASAAEATLNARTADPSNYTRQTFPAVDQAWQAAATSGDYQTALTQTAAAQRQLGIVDMKLLPKDIAEGAVTKFKDVNLNEQDRIQSAMSLVFSTPDRAQRQAVFEQLVDAGLPEITEGAVEALSRGDQGAARRLFQAAMLDPSKLPGQAPNKPAEIDETIQDRLMAANQIGDIYYGLSDGSTGNFIKAERDQKLMTNAVNLRIRNGEELESAVDNVAKDMFGDVQPVTSGFGVNAQILLPSKVAPEPVLAGLETMMPRVRDALASAFVIPEGVGGDKAVINQITENYVNNVLAEGYFRNSGDGFVFFDPYTGAAVAGADGQPMVFTLDDAIAAAPKPQVRGDGVDAPLTDDNFDAFQKRMGSDSKPVVDPDGFPVDISRQKLDNGDGSFSTEETATVEIDGEWVNIPTIWDGKRLSQDEALKRAEKEMRGGWQFPTYDTIDEAEAGARRRSDFLSTLRGSK